jgi:cytoskeletal protein RodZ
MRTIGQILKETRESKLLTLEDVEKQTKIRKELLEALERNDFDKLPPATFIQGFIKNYGKLLSLDTEKLLAMFRRDYEARKHPPQIMESFSNPIKNKKFRITPAKILGLVVVLIILGFLSYLWVEYRQFVGAPPLQVNSPKDQQVVDIPTVLVEGSTDPDTKVTVNNQEIGVDGNGHFSEEIKLSASTNQVEIVATSKFGHPAKTTRTVFVKK